MSKQPSFNQFIRDSMKDYTLSAAKNFDTVENIKEYFGDRWPSLSAQMRSISSRKQFAFYCMVAGIEGFPVQAWYDLYWGEGSFNLTQEQLQSKAIHHQHLARVYFAAANRAQALDKRVRWSTISAWHSACARRHLFNLIESKNDE